MQSRHKHVSVRMHHFREYIRNGSAEINKIPNQFQLAARATKPQTEDLIWSQRESLLQWESEGMAIEELPLPARSHLRACGISVNAHKICELSMTLQYVQRLRHFKPDRHRADVPLKTLMQLQTAPRPATTTLKRQHIYCNLSTT
jgi:hypothetical protein